MRSCHPASSREEQIVVPLQPAAPGLGANSVQVPQRRITDPGFPARNRRLLDPGDDGHLFLSDLEDFTADVANGVHADMHTRKCINFAITKYSSVLVPPYTNTYNLGMEIKQIIQGLLAARGWTQEQLAESLDTKQSNVSRWLAGVEPRGTARDQIMEMARDSGVIEDERAPRASVPIMGYIGAGAKVDPDYEQVPEDGLDQVALPLLLPDGVIGLQVRGDSMLPKYADGTVIVVHSEQTRSTMSLVGEEVAVRTYDGQRYLKVLMPGIKAHTYNLESFNARLIIGARIAWASQIIAIIPATQVRSVARPSRKKSSARPASKKDIGRER
jgi:repressor LexA